MHWQFGAVLVHRNRDRAKRLCVGLLASLVLSACGPAGNPDWPATLWQALAAGGYVMVISQANGPAPGGSDVGQCRARSHLSDTGQREAQRLAETLRQHAVPVSRVLTGHDCRCIETAGTLFGVAEPWSVAVPASDGHRQLAAWRSSALREAVSRWASAGNLAIVTHPESIEAAFGFRPKEAELLVFEPLGEEGFRLLGRLPGH